MKDLIERLAERRATRVWAGAASRAAEMDLSALRSVRARARAARRDIDRFLHIAEGRLAQPLTGAAGIRRPLHSDWAWRPDLWRGPISPPGLAAVESPARFGGGASLFHDCRVSELSLRQIRNNRPEDLAPFGLRMDVFNFDGSFLSLVLDLPEASLAGLNRRHIIRMDAVVELEKPLEIFVRLNIRHGPNTEQIVRELDLAATEQMVEFDLAYSKLNEKRVEKAWVDVIFEGPELNQIVLRDLTFCRRPRAAL